MDKVLVALSIITNKITTIEKNQNEFSLELKTIDKKVDDLKVSLDDLKTSLVVDLEPYFGNIEKHIDENYNKLSSKIDDNYNELSPKIESQENTIKLLSSRSIQQEADTNALNKIVRNQ